MEDETKRPDASADDDAASVTSELERANAGNDDANDDGNDDGGRADGLTVAEAQRAYSKQANMNVLYGILLFGLVAIIAIGFIANAIKASTQDGSSNAAQGSNAAIATSGNEGTNVTVTDSGTCSDDANASGCDGESDGTHGYEGLSDKQAALLDEVDTSVVIQGIEDGRTFVALFGYASCPDCKAAVPLLLDTAIDNGVSQVLYVDTRANPAWQSNTDIDGYDQLVSIMGDRFSTDEDGSPHMQAPFVVFVRNGQIVASCEGDDGLSKANDVDADSIGQVLIGKYDTGFKAMLGTSQSS